MWCTEAFLAGICGGNGSDDQSGSGDTGGILTTAEKVYLWVQDNGALGTGWVQTGTWSLGANQPPSVVSGTPTNATATPQTFTFTGRDPNGYCGHLPDVFSGEPHAVDPAEHLPRVYDRATNGIYLYNDALTALLGP